MKYRKPVNPHVGGEQILLITPDSDWTLRPLPDLRRCRKIALDRECRDDGLAADVGPGWATGSGFVCGTSIAWRDGNTIESQYVPVQHPDTECVDRDALRRWEEDHQKAGVIFVMQNAPFDVGWGQRDLLVPVPPRIEDTVCKAVMIDENLISYELDALCRWKGIPGKDERKLKEAMAAYGWGTTQSDIKKNIWRVPGRYVGPYAEQDAVSTLMLDEKLDPGLDEQEVRGAYDLEMRLLPVVHEMRRRGVRINQEVAQRAYDKFKRQSQEALIELSDKLSHTTSIDDIRSNAWLERAFTEHRIEFPRTQGGDGPGSFEAKWMKKHEHWLPRLIVRAKSREEAAEKFIQSYIVKYLHRGRLHASVNQFRSEDGGTRTYRFSYSDPPLQQMPHRDEELSEEIRGCFEPEEGEVWCSADYSQQEFRLDVHYAAKMRLPRAEEAAELYRKDPNTDFHKLVSTWTGIDRKPAKDANFAKSYGAGLDKFAAMIGKSLTEAGKIMATYDRELPFISRLFDACKDKVAKTGFIKLLDGARMRFDTWEPTYSRGLPFIPACGREEAERRIQDPLHPWYQRRIRRARTRNAMNCLIQGGAARMTKRAMVDCWEEGHVPMLQVHDELCFSVNSEHKVREIQRIMCDAVPLLVPMIVDAKLGRSWGTVGQLWQAVAPSARPREGASQPSAGPGRRKAAPAGRRPRAAPAARPGRRGQKA